MLVVLGALALVRAFRVRLHAHPHEHGGASHVHLHAHGAQRGLRPLPDRRARDGRGPARLAVLTQPRRLVVGITGATGTIFGIRLLQVLKGTDVETHLVVSRWGARTLIHETPFTLAEVR